MKSNKRSIFDIDIDVKSSINKGDFGIPMGIYNEENRRLVPHPSGISLDDITIDPITGLAALHYKEAEEEGIVKIDLLSNHVYDKFSSKKDIYELLEREKDIPWKMLSKKDYVDSLPHINGNFHIVSQIRPQSIEDLAATLAILRPGKIHLLETYLKYKEQTQDQLYKRTNDGKMYYKKSQAIAYAIMICIEMLSREQKNLFRISRKSAFS